MLSEWGVDESMGENGGANGESGFSGSGSELSDNCRDHADMLKCSSDRF